MKGISGTRDSGWNVGSREWNGGKCSIFTNLASVDMGKGW